MADVATSSNGSNGRPKSEAMAPVTTSSRSIADGSTRLIEVKTTGLGKYFPFNVTVNEVRCSEARPEEFQLYRVFNFGPDARLYMLPGAISGSCHLDATQYRAFVQSTLP